MKKLNSRDCMKIYCKAMSDLSNGVITYKEVKEVTKEADKAVREARKELAALKKVVRKER